MKKLLSFVYTAACAMILASCGNGGPDPVEVKGWTAYTDSITGLSVKYPANWKKQLLPGRGITIFSSKLGQDRFLSFGSEGFPGAMIDVKTFNLDSVTTLDSIVANQKKFPPEYYSAPIKLTIDGVPAVKHTYGFELEDGDFKGEFYTASKDGKKVTVLTFETFNSTMEKYGPAFQGIVKDMKLAKAVEKTVSKDTAAPAEAPVPSTTLVAKAGDGYVLQIPDNFRQEKGMGTAGKMYVGDRRGDSYINISIQDASKQGNLKKIVDKTVASIAGAKISSTKLGGKEAYLVSYNASSKVGRRMYFALHNGKLYQVTVDWFIAEQKDYLPVFEKSISSFKFQ